MEIMKHVFCNFRHFTSKLSWQWFMAMMSWQRFNIRSSYCRTKWSKPRNEPTCNNWTDNQKERQTSHSNEISPIDPGFESMSSSSSVILHVEIHNTNIRIRIVNKVGKIHAIPSVCVTLSAYKSKNQTTPLDLYNIITKENEVKKKNNVVDGNVCESFLYKHERLKD